MVNIIAVFSDSCGWLSAAVFLAACLISCNSVWDPPTARPSLIVVGIMALADFSNFYGSVLADNPTWQLVVALILLAYDAALVVARYTVDSNVTETSTLALKRAFVATFIACCVSLSTETIFNPSTRSLGICYGIISAAGNVAARVWYLPINYQPSTHHYCNTLAQFFYSCAILTHPDSERGQPYLEEAAPWLVGSILVATMEYSTAMDLDTRRKRQSICAV